MLDRTQRKTLGQVVGRARISAEAGARQALAHLTVEQQKPGPHLTTEQQKIRNRLRARARQLGDTRDARGQQDIARLTEQCAYEHWHRMLFARFLAENDLLIQPESGVAISLADCRELAGEQRREWIELASEYAVRMLPQVFRPDDPVLQVELPRETRAKLEAMLEELPAAVFTADDSLGWTYQFWQAEEKERINRSGRKIGAEELGAVTQLFTEDYMVDFLLHNTLGAWWAGKLGPIHGASEEEARARAALPARDGLPGAKWRYLRFVQGDGGAWRPAAGTFDGWPKRAREITVLDPCMGSGHFLVFALPLLTRLRAEEERLAVSDAVAAVLRDNLFGLELDERCTQIAAFNLALTAWRLAGYCTLPKLNLACSGLSIGATESDWMALADGDERLMAGMKKLHQLFRNAPTLGSLINPRARRNDSQIDSFVADFVEAAPLFEQALAREGQDENEAHELAVTAQGAARAAQLLTGTYTLIATNVPYLGRSKHGELLKNYAEQHHGHAKADLATCFVERCLAFCASSGTTALVTPQNWLFLSTYKHLRQRLLTEVEWDVVARLGPRAFETISGEVVNVALLVLTRRETGERHAFTGVDVSAAGSAVAKGIELSSISPNVVLQVGQLQNPDGILSLEGQVAGSLLRHFGACFQGLSSGDNPRFILHFWELPFVDSNWRFFQIPANVTQHYSGRQCVVSMHVLSDGYVGGAIRGREAWAKRGVAVSRIGSLSATLYDGAYFANTLPVIIPTNPDDLPAIWTFAESSDFVDGIRAINQGLSVDNGYIEKVAFDLPSWKQVATEKYPSGLPQPFSTDPTQWIFDGNPNGSDATLQVGVARLCAYEWPRQTDSDVPGCHALSPDGLDVYSDSDGIVCVPALQRESGAQTRLQALLVNVFGGDWNNAKQKESLAAAGARADSIDDWLRDEFFAQHCELFLQRPFILHIWDGLRDGFSALVNYHKLAASNGEGRRTLEKLTHTYLGDWIGRQRAASAAGEEGAETRLAAAEHLKAELVKILHGEPPYDIFVRWKPLHDQPIGWEPDINDGVRVNIRPFMMARPYNARSRSASILRATPRIKWDKDRGKEPKRSKEDYPWFWGWDQATVDFSGSREFDGARWNDLHYTRAAKQRAREAHAARTKGAPR